MVNVMNRFGQSKFIQLYSRHVQTKIDRCMPYGHELALQQYQDLGREAQQVLGIAPEFELSIKKIKGTSKMPAVAGSDGIYVNEEVFKTKSVGAQRCAMFHESVHAKYHDAAVLGILKIMGFAAGCVGMHELLLACDVVTLHKTVSVLAGIVSSLGLSFKYRQFMERRADMQGHAAANCSICVQEEIDQRTKTFDSVQKACFETMPEQQKQKYQDAFKKRYGDQDPTEILENFECMQGYLRRSDLKQIKQDLGDTKCRYHSEIVK